MSFRNFRIVFLWMVQVMLTGDYDSVDEGMNDEAGGIRIGSRVGYRGIVPSFPGRSSTQRTLRRRPKILLLARTGGIEPGTRATTIRPVIA
jgi:hypothetical protein